MTTLYRGADLHDLRRVVTRIGWAVRQGRYLVRHARGEKRVIEQAHLDASIAALHEAERVYLLVKLGVEP